MIALRPVGFKFRAALRAAESNAHLLEWLCLGWITVRVSFSAFGPRVSVASGDYQPFLSRNTLICSMSAMGHYGDNAACESFFGMLKRERGSHLLYRTSDEARANLFDYIERLHNPRMGT